MKNDGITLTELIIVISIIGILVVALGFSFQGWIGGSRVETQMKEMYTDLMNARVRAMSRSRVHFVTLAATQYTIYEDTNPAPNGNGALETTAPTDTQILQRNLDPSYPITWNRDTYEFNTRGLAASGGTICSNTDADADYNCIIISASRINLGKLTTKIPAPYNGLCDADNCVAK